MNRRIFFQSATAACSLSSLAYAQTTVNMFAIQDAFVSENYPAPNCDNNLLLGDVASSETWIYMEFDILSQIPSGANLTEVKLELSRYVDSSTNGGMATIFGRASTEWVDCAIGWGTVPDPLIVSTAPSFQIIPLPDGRHDVVFTDSGNPAVGLLDHFQKVLDGVRPQSGIVLIPISPDGYVQFSDIEDAPGPKLRVTYEVEDLPPEISVTQEGSDVPDDGAFSFGTADGMGPETRRFTITNHGEQALSLGFPAFTGPFELDDSHFAWEPVVSGGSSSVFFLRWLPTGLDPNSGSISFTTNDPNEDPFNFDLIGLPSELLQISSPGGGEEWVSGETHQIAWVSSDAVDSPIDIEYSPDSGDTWQAVSTVAPNTDEFEWVVPIDYGSNSKVRITGSTSAMASGDTSEEFTVASPVNVVADTFGGTHLNDSIWYAIEKDTIAGNTFSNPSERLLVDSGYMQIEVTPAAGGDDGGQGAEISSIRTQKFGKYGIRMRGAGNGTNAAVGTYTGFFTRSAIGGGQDNLHEIDVELFSDGSGQISFVVWVQAIEEPNSQGDIEIRHGKNINILIDPSNMDHSPNGLRPFIEFNDYEFVWSEDSVSFFINGEPAVGDLRVVEINDFVRTCEDLHRDTHTITRNDFFVEHSVFWFPDRPAEVRLNAWSLGATDGGTADFAGVYLFCLADLSGDNSLNFLDVSEFIEGYIQEDPIADFNSDGLFTFPDVSQFLQAYKAGCP